MVCFILLFTSSSACHKDQFAVSYFSTNNVRFVPLGCVLVLENSFDLTTLCSVCVQQIEPKTRQNWSPYFLKCYFDQILKCPFFRQIGS